MGFAHETVRVDAGALAGILDASERLLQEMSRGRARATERTIESTTAELLRELDHLRRLAAAYEAASGSHGARELRRRLERAFGNAAHARDRDGGARDERRPRVGQRRCAREDTGLFRARAPPGTLRGACVRGSPGRARRGE